MRTFVLKKLIRDKVLGSMLEEGQQPVSHILSHEEFLRELQKKIIEEARELPLKDQDKLLEELADIQEIIDVIVAEIGTSKADLERKQQEKNQKSGSFKKRIYVEQVAVPTESSWAAYYAKEPERFTEIPS